MRSNVLSLGKNEKEVKEKIRLSKLGQDSYTQESEYNFKEEIFDKLLCENDVFERMCSISEDHPEYSFIDIRNIIIDQEARSNLKLVKNDNLLELETHHIEDNKSNDSNDDQLAIAAWRMSSISKPVHDKITFEQWCEITGYVPSEKITLTA